jgi:hypothetical protein
MNTDDLLRQAREIWGNDKLTLEQVVICLGVVYGDLCRIARDKAEDDTINEDELKKELGNILFSTIRWCDDLGYSPEACIELAKQAQANYQQRRGQA